MPLNAQNYGRQIRWKMKRKASLEDLAKHCVPEDKGGITLSPVLQSGNSYVDVFPLPKKTGHLPLHLLNITKTYPKHMFVGKTQFLKI